MKKFLLPLALVLAAGVAVQAAETKAASKSTGKTTAAAKSTMHKSHVVDAEVVSADAAAKTITVKINGEDKTVPVHGKATTRLSSLKAGEKVALTCVDNAQGEHQYVSAIKVETTAPAKAKASKKSS